MSGIRTAWVLGFLLTALAPLWVPAASKSEKLAALSDELFTNTAIPHLEIEIHESDLMKLRSYRWRKGEDPELRPEVPAVVRENGRVYTNVAIHLKGAAGSFRPVDHKPGLTLNFDQWAEGQHFHGLQKISLNNSVQDPSYICEKLCRELYLEAGVPVPRSDFATVELNGRWLGLYVLAEGWNKQFLKRHFANPRGNLYDPGQGMDVNRTLRVSSGERPDDQSELIAIAQAIAETNRATLMARLEKLVDMDRFVSLVAMDGMTWNWDGYAMNKNNYRVFHDRDTGRVVFMPHGLDQMFWKPEGPVVTGRNGLLARALVALPEGRRHVLERVAVFRLAFFSETALLRRVEAIAARVAPSVVRDGLASAARYQGSLNILRMRIRQRVRSIDEQLAGAQIMVPMTLQDTRSLTNWLPCVNQGQPTLTRDQAGLLHIRMNGSGSAYWMSKIWLEEGRYTVSGKVKTSGVKGVQPNLLSGAGLRVWSNRKQSDGPSWKWFPFHESRDYQRRGEVTPTNAVPRRFFGDNGWTDLRYEVELRHPLADLEVRCELNASAGEAWFDPTSFRITRLTDWCP